MCSRAGRLRAFSLAELVVAIGVLVLMFSLAGQVFSFTIRSTGQAKALTDVSQLLRLFEQTLREDLRYVEPGQSLILIQGNPVNAYWTHQGKEADDDGDPANGYPHLSDPSREDENREMIAPRADMLMIFTARKGTSFVQPEITSNLQQVVYGQAELGEYVPDPDAPPDTVSYLFERPSTPAFPVDAGMNNYPSPTGVSSVPVEQWHLARRSVLLVPTGTPAGTADWPLSLSELEDLLQGKTDVIGNFSYERFVVEPGTTGPWYLPEVLRDGAGGINLSMIARSQLDPTPPATLAERLGHYFIPNCASFKVEWALNPRSEFVDGRLDGTTEIYWFDPGEEDPLASLSAVALPLEGEGPRELVKLLTEPTFHPDGLTPYSLSKRFGGTPSSEWPRLADDGRPNLVVFGAARWNSVTNEVVPEDIFPGALRITVDVFDDAQRLDRPIRHVMIVPVGG